MNERGFRFWAARLLAPIAFFAAATLLVLLVRESFDDDGGGLTVTQVVTNEDGEEVQITVVVGEPDSTTDGETTTAGPDLGGDTQAQTETEEQPVRRPRSYRIRAGDTLEGIASRFGITVEELIVANEDIDAVALQTGQRITIPRPAADSGGTG